MTYALLVLLIVGATYRVTRFIVVDDFPPMAWLRDKLIVRIAGVDEDGQPASRTRMRWAEGVVCSWCMSVYIGAGLTLAADAFYSLPAPVFVWLTASGVTGLLAEVGED